MLHFSLVLVISSSYLTLFGPINLPYLSSLTSDLPKIGQVDSAFLCVSSLICLFDNLFDFIPRYLFLI